MAKVFAGMIAAAALLGGTAFTAPLHLYPTFKPAHIRSTITTFQVTGATGGTFPAAINDSGVIAGTYWFGIEKSQFGGFVRAADGTITTFQAPGAGDHNAANGTEVFGMNAAGDIAGTAIRNDVHHGYLRMANGTFVTFDPRRSTTTDSTGINNSDTITGFYVRAGTPSTFGFVRAADGSFTTFRVGSASKAPTFPHAINDAGTVAGVYIAPGGQNLGFVRTASGTVSKFDLRSTQNQVLIAGINTAGTVAGAFVNSNKVWVSFLRAPTGQITKFGVPGAGTNTFQGTIVTGLNDAGDTVGGYVDSGDHTHGFLRSAGGTVTTFDVNVSKGIDPTGINASGTVAGSSGKTGFVLN